MSVLFIVYFVLFLDRLFSSFYLIRRFQVIAGLCTLLSSIIGTVLFIPLISHMLIFIFIVNYDYSTIFS